MAECSRTLSAHTSSAFAAAASIDMPRATPSATSPKNAPAPSVEYGTSMARSLARAGSDDLELGSVDPLRGELDVDLLGDAEERLRRFVLRIGHDDRSAFVGADPQLRHQRHLAEQRHF